jgi:hypothetical protein
MIFRIKEKRYGCISEISQVLDKYFKETNTESEYSVELLKKDWSNIVGNIIATHSCPVRISGKTLNVFADHPVFANDIVLMNEIILGKLNSIYSGRKITEIKVEVNKKMKWKN